MRRNPFQPTVLEIANEIRHFGKAYTFHHICSYWNPIKALYLIWVATETNKKLYRF